MTVDHVVFVPGYLLDSRLWESAIRALGDRVTAQVPELGPFTTIGEMAESILERAPAPNASTAAGRAGGRSACRGGPGVTLTTAAAVRT